jgi:hypothetical protein
MLRKLFPYSYVLLDADKDGSGGGGGSEDDSKTGDDKSSGGTKNSGYSEAQYKAAIEKARLEERTKLREQVDSGKESSAQLKEAREEIAKLKGDLKTVTDSLTAIQNAKSKDGDVDVAKVIAEVTEKVGKEYETRLGGELQTLRSNLNALQLKDLKIQLIEEAGGPGKLILAMVDGKTEDELRASIERSKTAYQEVESRIRPSKGKGDDADKEEEEDQEDDETATNDAKNRKTGSNVPPDVDGNAGGNGAGGGNKAGNRGRDGSLLTNVRRMSPADYKANREKVLKDIQKRYPKVA